MSVLKENMFKKLSFLAEMEKFEEENGDKLDETFIVCTFGFVFSFIQARIPFLIKI